MAMDINPFFDHINHIGALFAALLTFLLGEHWVLFVGFLLLNVGDYVTGCIKARITKTSNSAKGTAGVLKKLGYWIMVLVAFGMSAIFVEIGESLHVDLRVTEFIGWFVLGSLIMNEFRSILENFVESGYNVPQILVKGLEVADKVMDKIIDDEEDGDDI